MVSGSVGIGVIITSVSVFYVLIFSVPSNGDMFGGRGKGDKIPVRIVVGIAVWGGRAIITRAIMIAWSSCEWGWLLGGGGGRAGEGKDPESLFQCCGGNRTGHDYQTAFLFRCRFVCSR